MVPPTLVSPGQALQILSVIPDLYDLDMIRIIHPFDTSFQNSRINSVGVRRVSSYLDPCSNLWYLGAFNWDGHRWSSREHAIAYEKIKAMTACPSDMVRITLEERTRDNAWLARQHVKNQLSLYDHRAIAWSTRSYFAVLNIMKAAALQDFHLLSAILDPRVTKFNYEREVEGEGTDPRTEWLFPELRQHGEILWQTREQLQAIASAVHHILRGHNVSSVWASNVVYTDLPSAIQKYVVKTMGRRRMNLRTELNIEQRLRATMRAMPEFVIARREELDHKNKKQKLNEERVDVEVQDIPHPPKDQRAEIGEVQEVVIRKGSASLDDTSNTL